MKGRGLLIALVVSLAANLFLVGLGAGALLFGHRPGEAVAGQPQGGPRRAPLWMAARGLSEQYRPAYRQVLRNAVQAARGDLAEARQLKRSAFDAMASDTYDPKAVAADLEKARGLEFKARTRLEQDITAFAATLPPTERAALADALRTAMTNRLQQNMKARAQDGRPTQ